MNRERRWTSSMLDWSAGLGGTAWLILAGHDAAGESALGLIEWLVLLAVLVIVPLGMRLTGSSRSGGRKLLVAASLIQPPAAAMVVISFWTPAGPAAAMWISGWLLLTGLLALFGTVQLAQHGRRGFAEACRSIALLFLPVGAGWLAASRAGIRPMGFEEPIVLLTAMHFHYAGFAATLFVGLALPRLASVRVNRLAAVGVIAGTPLLAAGFVLATWLKVIAAILLLGGLGVICARVVRVMPHIRNPAAQLLLTVSCVSAIGAALPALVYVTGEVTGRDWISIPTMTNSHGVLNGLGFSLCGLLGWRILESGPSVPNHAARLSVVLLLGVAVASGSWMPAWAWMWTLSAALFLGFKGLTLSGSDGHRGLRSTLAYCLGWPGMNPRAFFNPAVCPPPTPMHDWMNSTIATLIGAGLMWIAAPLIMPRSVYTAGAIGFVGMIMMLHFGLFHLLALFWRRRGRAVRPIMDRPWRAVSLSDFWGRRWNVAFRRVAHHNIFRPLAQKLGTAPATLATFAASGLIHDLVISLPARGGDSQGERAG